MRKQLNVLFAGAVALSGVSLMAQPAGQWDFNSGTLAPTVGTAALDYITPASQTGVQFGSTTSFGIAKIGGVDANVMKFSSWNTPDGLKMPITSAANGGGSLVNQWSLAMDLLFPASSDKKWRALIETDNRIIDADADLFVNPSNGLGISGNYSGNVTPDVWHRIVFAIDGDANKIYKYLDGALVGVQDEGAAPDGGLDGRFTLSPGGIAELFTDNDGDIAPGYVNSIQVYDKTLNAGEVQALGAISAAGLPTTLGPVPAFIQSSSPVFGATGVDYLPAIHVDFNAGGSTVPSSSLSLLLDSQPVAASIGGDTPAYTLDFTVTDPLDPGAAHTVGVVYTENGTKKTNSFSFTVANYQKITLPEPFFIENFNLVAEGSLPDGWTRTNHTDVIAGHNHDTLEENLNDLKSDVYLDWTVVDSERIRGLKGDIANLGTILLNGTKLDSLSEGNMLYAESDVRDGSQVQVVFTKDYDFSGKKNVFVAFSSLYEQNQDNINSLEYSIDSGATWLPALYLIDRVNNGGDIAFNPDGSVDAVTTMNKVWGGAAYGTSYGVYIGAPITQALAPYISGRVDDDSVESKRIEVIRLFAADNQPKVRFRFMQAGTASWYWGIDNFGFYSIPEPKVIFPPTSVTVNYDANASFKVVASGDATLTYQWYKNGNPITGATADTLTITHVTAANDADYSVKVSNNLGSAMSSAAHLTVLLSPVIATPPQQVLASAGAPFSLEVEARGQAPFGYQWNKDNTPISTAKNSAYVVSSAQVGDSGMYTVTITNAAGSITSTPVKVTILPLIPITQDLVVHYAFDSDLNDSSGRNNNPTPEIQPEITDGVLPAPGTDAKQIGAGSLHLTDGQDLALGQPEDLIFGSDVNFTYSFWVRGTDANAWTGDPSFIGNKNWTAGGNLGFVLAAQGGGSWTWNWKADAGSRHDSGGKPSVTDGNFHHILVSHDRQGLAYIYLDGILLNTVSIANEGSIDSLPIYIGQDGTGRYGFNNDLGAHFKSMWLDDFGIWRRLLTPQEVASIYTKGKAGQDLTQASGQAIVLPPTITTQPLGAVLSPNGSFTLSVGAGGTAPFTYEWRKDGTTVATSKTLPLTAVTTSAAGNYDVIVRNASGSVTSAVAKVAVTTASLSQDLVAYLKFNGDYADATGRGNNGTAHGSPTFDNGRFGQAVKTTITSGNTGDNYISLGTPADLSFGDSSNFSVSMWVNVTTSSSDPPYISNKDWNSSSNPGWGIFAQGGGNFRVNATGTPGGSGNRLSATLSQNIRDGNWHNVIVSFARGNVASTYLDGVLVNNSAFTITGSVDTGLPINIGQDGTGHYGGTSMTALIDDVAFWRRALSAQEAERIATSNAELSTLVPAQLKITSFVFSGGQVTLTVQGNSAGARLEKRTSLTTGTWQDVGAVSGTTSFAVGSGEAYFRIVNP